MTLGRQLLPFLREHRVAAYFGLLVVVCALQFSRPILLDDAYITFRAARNFAQGHGLTFNQDEKVLSTTAPGYALLLAGLHGLKLDIVVAAKLTCIAALLLAGYALLRIFQHRASLDGGLFAALALCLSPELMKAWGNECPLLLACALLAYHFLDRRCPLPASLFAVLGCLIRPDFALLALLLGLVCLRGGRRQWLLFLPIPLIVSIAWLAFLQHEFHSLLPTTLAIKQEQGLWIAQGDSRGAIFVSFARGLRWLIRRTIFEHLLGVFCLFGSGLLLVRRQFLLLLLWSLLHVAAYLVLQVPGTYAWYYYPLWLLFALCTGHAFSALFALIGQMNSPRERHQWQWLLGCLALYCLMDAYGAARDDWALRKDAAYRAIAEKILARTPPSASIQLNEIGLIGYLTHRRIIDAYGLIHRAAGIEHGNTLAALAHYQPDYVVNEGWQNLAPPGFTAQVEAKAYQINVPLSPTRNLVYRQIDYAAVPPDFLPVLLQRTGF